jgi:cellobiose-specific phosphotransferase system component IIA
MEDMMENLCMHVIANSGAAKSKYITSIELAGKDQFDEAIDFLEKGKIDLQKGAEAHLEMLKLTSREDGNGLSLLMVHAEDHLSTAELLEKIAEEMVRLYQKVSKCQ